MTVYVYHIVLFLNWCWRKKNPPQTIISTQPTLAPDPQATIPTRRPPRFQTITTFFKWCWRNDPASRPANLVPAKPVPDRTVNADTQRKYGVVAMPPTTADDPAVKYGPK